ncbi:MAG: esterase-like activity of phytase family protein [Pseudomonadota bacterium]
MLFDRLRLGASVCAAALLIATPHALASDVAGVFNRIASFPVPLNAPDPSAETSAEIIDATEDGMMLLYSDSPLEAIGMIDISDPANPQPAGIVALEGEPTAVAVAGPKALVGINTFTSFTAPSGMLGVIDIASRSLESTCDIGGQPDSLAVAPDGAFVAIAIENERDEDLNDGIIPQLPAGNLQIVPLSAGVPDCAAMVTVDLTGLAEVAPGDPEPEFVDINAAGEIAVTLQENNHVVIVDGASGSVTSHFSAGAVDLENVDLDEERALTFDGTQPSRVREPDAVKWLDNDRLVIANEGDYQGGSRGFTIFADTGEELFESGLQLEYAAAMAGHYPERRSGNKGVEPEGMEVGVFGDDTHIFVLLERSSLVGVYRDTGGDPEFLQLLPSGIGPEGAVAIPDRNLFVTANEVDLIEDGGVRAHVMIYALGEGPASYPTIVSGMDEAGRPVGWGALSGLAADPETTGTLYAVNDSFYGLQPTIFTIDATRTPATITDATRVTRGGFPAQKLDLEGIVTDPDGGFWLASEGRTDRLVPHAIYKVDASGEIDMEIPIPRELIAVERRFGFEGITMVGEGEAMTLWMATQREWADDAPGLVKLVSYTPASGEWGAVRYPLELKGAGWVGLSEITAHGDFVYILERDNQIGAAAALKSLYRVPLAEMAPAALGGDLPVVTKERVRNFIPDLASYNGYVVDKIEGFAIDAEGTGYAVTDNDGVDDSSGETFFFSIGQM